MISLRISRLSRPAAVALAIAALCCGTSSAWASDGYPRESVRAIRLFGDQTWVGTDDGLAMHENGEWTTWARTDGLPASPLSAIDIDPETLDVWLGTWGSGLVRFSGGRFDRFSQFNSGLAGDLVFDVAVAQGRVWVATVGGVSSFDAAADAWELYYPRKAYAPETAVTTLAAEGDDLYAGLSHGGVERFDSATRSWTPVVSGPRHAVGDISELLKTLPLSAGEGPSDPESGVAVAIYGPRNRTVALPGQKPGVPTESARPDLLAVEISIDRANSRGGYRDSEPFSLVKVSAGYDRYGWGLPEDDIVVFSRDRRVMGIVGHLVPDQRIADAVVLRTGLPWVNVAPTIDKGEPPGEANPWVFHCYGDEPARHRMLLDHTLDALGHKRLALLRTVGRETAARLDWWSSHADKRGRPVVAELEWSGGGGDHGETLAALRAARADVVVTWTDKGTTADIVRRIRAAGLSQPVVVSSACVADDFAALVGVDPGELIALDPTASEPVGRGNESFAENYVERDPRRRARPSAHAHRSFAATEHLLHAVNTAGPDRVAVRRTLEVMSRRSTGEEHYEQLFEAPPTRFARLREGKWVYRTTLRK